MEPNTKECGRMINSQDKGKKVGQMAQFTKEIIKRAKSTVLEFSNGLMGQFTKEILSEITLKDLVLMFGLTFENTRVSGSLIKCMEKENFHGQMEGFTKESILMTKRMDKAPLHGQTVENTSEVGKTASNMEKELTSLEKEKADQVNGTKDIEFHGTITNHLKNNKIQ